MNKLALDVIVLKSNVMNETANSPLCYVFINIFRAGLK